ncbi:MAG: hypothetical protein AAFW68_03910 [Pseudomonadota bacterium]
MNEHYDTAKKAIASFLDYYHRAVPGVEIVIGFAPSTVNKLMWAGMLSGTLGYAFYATWREGMMTTLWELLAFAMVVLFMSLFMAWSFLRNTGSRRKAALDLFEKLSG